MINQGTQSPVRYIMMDMEKVDEVEAEHDDEDAQKSRQISHKDVL